MIYVIVIKHNKFSYSSIESQLFHCTPACCYKFHALEVYLHPTFTVPFQSESHLDSSRTSVVDLNIFLFQCNITKIAHYLLLFLVKHPAGNLYLYVFSCRLLLLFHLTSIFLVRSGMK